MKNACRDGGKQRQNAGTGAGKAERQPCDWRQWRIIGARGAGGSRGWRLEQIALHYWLRAHATPATQRLIEGAGSSFNALREAVEKPLPAN
jgi:hypothetical protein